jgi:phosphotransferase system enzyme I (PtsI)
MLLLGLGLRRFSATPAAIPELKNLVRKVSIEQSKAVAAHVMTMENAREIKSYLIDEMKKCMGETRG